MSDELTAGPSPAPLGIVIADGLSAIYHPALRAFVWGARRLPSPLRRDGWGESAGPESSGRRDDR